MPSPQNTDGPSPQMSAKHPAFAFNRRRAVWVVAAVAALTIPAALVQGKLLGRWGGTEELTEFTRAIEQLPEDLQQWRIVQDGPPLAEYLVELLDLKAYSQKVYQHRVTGQRVTALLLVARSGPLVRHPPEICYAVHGNRLLNSTSISLPAENEARLLAYRIDRPVPGGFFVAYAFSDGERWSCPKYPRLEYAGRPALVKIQLLTNATATTIEREPTELIEFAGLLLEDVARKLPTKSG